MPNKPLIKIVTFILDDDALLLEIIKSELPKAGIFDFEIFSNPYEFFEDFTEDVQIAVLDYDLKSSMTGVEVLKKIRQQNPTCSIIFMSNQIDKQVFVELINCGYTKYIPKDSHDFIDKLILYIKESIDEFDRKLRYSINLASKLKETITLFEKLKNTYRNGINQV